MMLDTYRDITRKLMEISVELAPEFHVNDFKREKLIGFCEMLDNVLERIEKIYDKQMAVDKETHDIVLSYVVSSEPFFVEEKDDEFYKLIPQCKRFRIKTFGKSDDEKIVLEFTVDGIWE